MGLQECIDKNELLRSCIFKNNYTLFQVENLSNFTKTNTCFQTKVILGVQHQAE